MTPYYQDDKQSCDCGCGSLVSPGRHFVSGHNLRQLERTAAHRAAISAACTAAWATRRKRKPLGSTRLDANGYVLVKVREGGGRWDKEHVLVVERRLGRRLVVGEHVHHINGVKTDNRPENLHLAASPSEHSLIHGSLAALLPELIASGRIVFDRAESRYRCG